MPSDRVLLCNVLGFIGIPFRTGVSWDHIGAAGLEQRCTDGARPGQVVCLGPELGGVVAILFDDTDTFVGMWCLQWGFVGRAGGIREGPDGNVVGVKEDEEDAEPPDFSRHVFSFTGTMAEGRRDIERLCRQLGARTTGSVTTSTTLLIEGAHPGQRKKAAARKYGIPVINERTFYSMADRALVAKGCKKRFEDLY